MSAPIDYQALQQRVHEQCIKEHWGKDWQGGGVYLHLESSELIEALRGKSSNPVEEGGDVIFTLMALLAHYEIDIHDCFRALIVKMDEKEKEASGKPTT